MYAMEALLEGPKSTQQCVSFDFEECSLSNLQKDYPWLLRSDHGQHMYCIFILFFIVYSYFI
jgi:hypothetical protein